MAHSAAASAPLNSLSWFDAAPGDVHATVQNVLDEIAQPYWICPARSRRTSSICICSRSSRPPAGLCSGSKPCCAGTHCRTRAHSAGELHRGGRADGPDGLPWRVRPAPRSAGGEALAAALRRGQSLAPTSPPRRHRRSRAAKRGRSECAARAPHVGGYRRRAGRHSEAMVRRIQELHALGVRIALDDFGSRYSNLGYLQPARSYRRPWHSAARSACRSPRKASRPISSACCCALPDATTTCSASPCRQGRINYSSARGRPSG
jgi:hypothetical protein